MKTILLIEDDRIIRENTAEILELSDYRVFTAANGKDGVASAVQHRPDLIICDIMMPLLDGYGVVHLLQRKEETKNIPFIFLTAKVDRSEVRKGMQLGADDYITKPFSESELLTAVETRLKKREQIHKEISSGLKRLDELMVSADSDEVLRIFTQERETLPVKKKQVVYPAGSMPHKMYFIKKGKVKTYKTNDAGKELIINLYNENDFFGHIALLENDVYKETAETLEETELAIIPREDFEKLINNNSEVALKFVRLLANNITDKEQQLLNMAYNSLRKKVADALIAFDKKYRGNGENFAISLSRLSLANIAGTAKESLVRVLSDFKEEALIDIVEHGDIVIKNHKKLQNLAG